MNASDISSLLLVGFLAGVIGQGVRVIIGLKKAYGEASSEWANGFEVFDMQRFILSLFIGGVAGCIGIFTLDGVQDGKAINISIEMLFGVVGIGYAGADFIEGFVRTKVPTSVNSMYSMRKIKNNFPYNFDIIGVESSGRIKEVCHRLLKIRANASDCSLFVKSVVGEFSVNLSGQANDIFDQLTKENGWTVLGDSITSGRAAAEAAKRGELVIGAKKGEEHGHVVVVVEGSPLAHGKYPFAYWGKLDDPDGAGFNRTVNWAWNKEERDGVLYATRVI